MPDSAGKTFAQRSTTDLLVLLIASTICAAVLLTGATLGLLQILRPSVDTTGLSGNLFDVITTLIGLLAGFLAGRTDKQTQVQQALMTPAPSAPASEPAALPAASTPPSS